MNGFQVESQILVFAALLMTALIWMGWKSYSQLPGPSPEDAEAEGRARRLLHELLSESEHQQLTEAGYLSIASPNIPDRLYRVPSTPGWVDVYEADKLTMRVCVEPVERLPISDVVLMHKLLIQGDEQEYLRQANVVFVRSPSTRFWYRQMI